MHGLLRPGDRPATMTAGGPRPVLSLFDSVAITVGVVVGAGIFRLPSLVAEELGSAWLIGAVWLLGGLISLVGALCFAELATAHPHPGGEYHFLCRAYGRSVGFMFGWARVTVVQTGSIALLAFIFGDYANELLPLGPQGAALWAIGSVVVLTGLNIAGVRQTRAVQNVLFAAMLAGLLCIIGAGALLLSPVGTAAAPVAAAADAQGRGPGALGLAMILVLLTYGGWNEAAYISAEVKDRKRNMVRALLIGIGLITLLYMSVNMVYLLVLGPGGMAASPSVARDVMDAAFGPAGSAFITVLIVAVVLASINVTIFTGARAAFALGRDFRLLGFLGHWSEPGGAPVRALLLQGAISLGLVLLGAVGRSGVQTMVDYLSPVFWLFFLLTGLALFVLRHREPGVERPFEVPLYPVTPALFCLTSAYLLYSSLAYTGIGALAGVAVLLLGLPLLLVARRMPARARAAEPAEPRPPATLKEYKS
jgi:basic amino acid/polyamine antiporter, APA family